MRKKEQTKHTSPHWKRLVVSVGRSFVRFTLDYGTIFKNEKLNKFKFIEMTPGYKSKVAHIFGFHVINSTVCERARVRLGTHILRNYFIYIFAIHLMYGTTHPATHTHIMGVRVFARARFSMQFFEWSATVDHCLFDICSRSETPFVASVQRPIHCNTSFTISVPRVSLFIYIATIKISLPKSFISSALSLHPDHAIFFSTMSTVCVYKYDSKSVWFLLLIRNPHSITHCIVLFMLFTWNSQR